MKLRLASLSVIVLSAAAQLAAVPALDVDAALDYCTRQVHRSLDALVTDSTTAT